MKALVSALTAAAMAALLFLPMSVPAQAQERAFTADVTQVQYRHRDRNRWRDRHYGRRNHGRGHHRGRYNRRHGPSFGIIIAPPPIYYSRPRYVVPRPHYGGSGGHVDWCYARYRSYRAYDNTFQPYHGPRKPCYSPYS